MSTPYLSLPGTTMLAPLPAALVSCGAENSAPNALAVAWTGVVCSHPPMVSISLKPERYSHGLIRSSGEFVVNLVDPAHARALDYCGVRSGRDEDKLAACGLTPLPVEGLRYAPMIEGMPVCLACRVIQRLSLGSHDMFIGQVESVHVRGDLADEDGSLHLERAGLVCYTHGVYQQAAEALGFFGWSVARPEALKRRFSAMGKE